MSIAVFLVCNSSANAFALLLWNSRRGGPAKAETARRSVRRSPMRLVQGHHRWRSSAATKSRRRRRLSNDRKHHHRTTGFRGLPTSADSLFQIARALSQAREGRHPLHCRRCNIRAASRRSDRSRFLRPAPYSDPKTCWINGPRLSRLAAGIANCLFSGNAQHDGHCPADYCTTSAQKFHRANPAACGAAPHRCQGR